MPPLNLSIVFLSLATAFSGSAAAPVPGADSAALSRRAPAVHRQHGICYPRKRTGPGARRPSLGHPSTAPVGHLHRRAFDRAKVGMLLGFHGTRKTEGEAHNEGQISEHKGTGGKHLGGQTYVANNAETGNKYAESAGEKHSEEPALCFVYAANDDAWLTEPKAWLNVQEDASMFDGNPKSQAKLTKFQEDKRAKTAKKAGATEDVTTEFVRFSWLLDDKEKVTEGTTQFALTHEQLTKHLVVLHCHIGEAAITAAMATPEGQKVFHYNGADATSWNVKGVSWLEEC